MGENWTGSGPENTSLRVGVIGAGLAGLAAAIGLGRAGHQVEVFPAATIQHLAISEQIRRYSKSRLSQARLGPRSMSVRMRREFYQDGVLILSKRNLMLQKRYVGSNVETCVLQVSWN